MTQTKRQSLAETVTSTAIGYVVALVSQAVIYPLFGLEVSGGQHVAIAALFTVVSIVRGYAVRRLFNAVGNRNSADDALYASYLVGYNDGKKHGERK